MISVIVADDHAVVRTGLQLIFQDSLGISLKGEANNGNDLLLKLKSDNFDVAIVDINMPGISSLELISEIKQQHPNLPIIVFTMNQDEQLATRMFKNGALAYINKEEDPEELIKAVRCVVDNGRRYLTKRQEYFFANQFIMGNEESQDHNNLTDREYQIMCLLAEGKSKTEIAEKLDISKNTLSNHRNNILKKLNLCNNAELTKYALNHQLIQ